jgi:hypothetical protein
VSPLLVVAVALLVLVVGLTLLQRRAHAQSSPPRRDTPPTAPPARATAADAPRPRKLELSTDPLLGDISYDGDTWLVENDLDLHGSVVLVEISGTADGPTSRDHEIVKAALARPDLDTRARTLVLHELERRGVDSTGINLYELAVGPDDDGVLHGYVWYEVPELVGEIGVKSSDHWRTITLEVVE